MKIKMIKTSLGQDVDEKNCPLPVKSYEKGESYNVGESLAKTFLDMKVAEKGSSKKKAEEKMQKDSEEKEDKKMEGAPENKQQGFLGGFKA